MEEVKLTGACHCGAVRFQYHYSQETKPIFNGYCHCALCRSLNSASGVHLLGLPKGSFTITQGEESLATYNPTPNFFRRWCCKCGTAICQGPLEAPFIATFPSTYDDARQQFPQGKQHPVLTSLESHANMENANMPEVYVAQGLPVWEQYPPAIGGPERPYKLPPK